jgi:chromosome segregation ATPase
MGEGVTPLLLRLKEIETRLEEAQYRLSDKDDVIRDLRQRLDESTQERHRLTLLLTHHAEHQPPPPKGFWAWLFG